MSANASQALKPSSESSQAGISYYYLHNRIKPSLLSNENIKALIRRILTQAKKPGDNIEKLHHKQTLFSARLSKRARLIFSHINQDDKTCLLIVDVLQNHEYQKLKKLPNMLQHYQLESLESKAMLPTAPIQDKCVQAKPIVQLDTRHYTLSREQQNALQYPLPLIVNGAPGSGKSLSAVSRLGEFVTDYSGKLQQNILYVCQSQRLANYIETLWLNSNYAHIQQQKPITIEFKSYAEFIGIDEEEKLLLNQENINDEKHSLTLICEDEKQTWFNKAIKALSRQPEWKKLIGKHKQSIEFNSVFTEFRFICVATKEQYLSPKYGNKNTLFANSEQKKIVYRLFERYQSYLKENNKIDLQFYKPEKIKPFDLGFFDETQDFSLNQFRVLLQACNGKALMCLDTHQSFEYKLSLRPLLNRLLQQMQLVPFQLDLEQSYRSSTQVIRLANDLLTIKQHLCQGQTDKHTYHTIDSAKTTSTSGFIKQVESNKQAQDILKSYKNSRVIVLTTRAQIESAKRLYPDYIVTCAQDIKGMEFDFVICHNPLATNAFKRANSRLTKEKICLKPHRSKEGYDPYNLSIAFNEFFTAITRARIGVVVVEKESVHNKNLLHHLKFNSTQNDTTNIAENKEKTTREDWIKTINTFISHGNDKAALETWIRQKIGNKEEGLAHIDSLRHQQKNRLKKLRSIANSHRNKPQHKQHKKTNYQRTNNTAKKRPTNDSISLGQKKNYIENLLNEFTEENVIKLLNHKNCYHYLFKIKLNPHGLNLYQTIENNQIYNRIFCRACLKRDYAKYLLTQHEMTIKRQLHIEISNSDLGLSKHDMKFKGKSIKRINTLLTQYYHSTSSRGFASFNLIFTDKKKRPLNQIMLACLINNSELIAGFLSKNSQLGAINEAGYSVLEYAAIYASNESLIHILEYCKEQQISTDINIKTIACSAMANRRDNFTILLNHCSFNRDIVLQGSAFLNTLIEHEHYEMAEELLSHPGFSINYSTLSSFLPNPFVIACEKNQTALAKLLIEKEVIPPNDFEISMESLILAAKHNNAQLFVLVLSTCPFADKALMDLNEALASNKHSNQSQDVINMLKFIQSFQARLESGIIVVDNSNAIERFFDYYITDYEFDKFEELLQIKYIQNGVLFLKNKEDETLFSSIKQDESCYLYLHESLINLLHNKKVMLDDIFPIVEYLDLITQLTQLKPQKKLSANEYKQLTDNFIAKLSNFLNNNTFGFEISDFILANGTPFIHHAININNQALFDFYLENNGNVDILNHADMTPLMLALLKKSPNYALKLIDKSTAIHQVDRLLNKTALMYALELENTKPLEKLLEKSIAYTAYLNINHQNKLGQTALILAVQKGNRFAVGKLVALGADIKVKDNNNKSAIDYTIDIKRYDIYRLLSEKPASALARNSVFNSSATSSGALVESPAIGNLKLF